MNRVSSHFGKYTTIYYASNVQIELRLTIGRASSGQLAFLAQSRPLFVWFQNFDVMMLHQISCRMIQLGHGNLKIYLCLDEI